MPEDQPAAPTTNHDPDHGSFPLLLGAQVEAFALLVRRETCTEIASMLRTNGHPSAASLVNTDRDFTELSRSMAAIPTPIHEPEHAARCRAFRCRCGCDPAQSCQDCRRCPCWRSQCCAQTVIDAERRRARTTALRTLLDTIGRPMLTELRQTAAEAEEAALRNALSRRTWLLVPGNGHYTQAVFEAVDSKLGVDHADFSAYNVELYAQGQDDPIEVIDLNDDDGLSRLLGSMAALIRPAEGARLEVDLAQAHS
ncbi:hypothetical protein OG613_49070 (plasmid) [Streptomyces sp. NBC_00015]|uniref:hypothetical protein n=1 Tax=Streptomyces sp. NBC_00015 TaxID=2903611 RepID=UPI002F908D43